MGTDSKPARDIGHSVAVLRYLPNRLNTKFFWIALTAHMCSY